MITSTTTAHPAEYSIPKSDFQQIRVSIHVYNQHEFLDIRTYFRADDEKFKPTKKGITLSPTKIPDLVKYLNELYDDWEKQL